MPYSFFCSFYTKSTEPLNSHPASPVLALLSHAHQREFLTIRLAHLTKWAARACHFQKIWVCLKIGSTTKPNGFHDVNDRYPYEKWLFHWEYTLFSDKPIWQQDWRWGPQRILMGYSPFCELEMHSSNGNWWNCVCHQEPASFFPKAVDNEAQSASGAVPKINCCSWRSRKPNIWTNVSVLALKKRQTTYSLKRSRDSGSPKHLPFCDGKKEPKIRSSAGMPSCFSSCSRSLGTPVTVMMPIGWLPASKELMDWNRCLHIQQTQQASQALDGLMDATGQQDELRTISLRTLAL